MESFLALSAEKQHVILEAGFSVFGQNGYKKSSVHDIAVASGISKAMIFHYFGTKKALYLYLADVCCGVIFSEFIKRFDKSVTDFFDRILMASQIKIDILKQYRGLLSFLEGMYYETDEEVAGDVQQLLNERGAVYLAASVYDGMDTSKFKEGIDPKVVMKILQSFTAGCVKDAPRGVPLDIEAILEEVIQCVTLLRDNFYKDTTK